jgi:hypothetical protein
MLLKDKPNRPSDLSEANSEETIVAISTAWPVTEVPPTFTTSVPTVPEAPLPSPYVILHL